MNFGSGSGDLLGATGGGWARVVPDPGGDMAKGARPPGLPGVVHMRGPAPGEVPTVPAPAGPGGGALADRTAGLAPEVGHHVLGPSAPGPGGAMAAVPTAPPRVDGGVGGLDPRLSFDAFVVGSSNRLAHNAALGVAESTVCPYNPLFIYGDSGNGKTHLLHAIGLHVRAHAPGNDVRYVTCERFTSEFIQGIQASPSGGFTSRYRSCSFLLVDDLQFLEGRVETQKEFFHTFNEVTAAGGRVVLSADCHPGDIPALSERLRSRFASGLVADLGAPEFETRVAILARKAEAQGAQVDDEVLAMVASSVTRSVRELEGALTRVLADAALEDRPVSVAGARGSLQSFLGSTNLALSCERIIEEAAEVFGVTVEALCGYSRTRALVQARQSAMYVCRSLTEESLPAIGRAFSHRDHTTVLHAVRKIEQLMTERALVYAKVVELTNRLGGKRGVAAARCEEDPPG